MNINRRGFFGLLAGLALGVTPVAETYTQKLVRLAKTVMRRSSTNNHLSRMRLKDVYISPAAMEDIRNWTINEIDDVARREIYSC